MSRFTIDLSGEFDRTLSELADTKEATKADILRRALITYAALDQEAREEGKNVSITKDGAIVKDIILP